MTDTIAECITLGDLHAMTARGEKIASLTCYDAGFTRLLEAAGVEVFIIGDSLGMVLMGHDSTVPVTMRDMVYHAANVARVGQHAFRVVDLPYRSYTDATQALHNARRLVDEGGAHMVKLEGGSDKAGIVAQLVEAGIPVCGHIGLLPQSVEQFGGYKVQGRDADSAASLRADAQALEAAGAGLLVMECMPAALAADITQSVAHPHHWHRRRSRLRRAGAGAVRHARHHPGQAAALRTRFPRHSWQHRRGGARLRRCREDRRLPGTGALLLRS